MRARPTTGPLLALAGALGLLVFSFLSWYEVDLAGIEGGAVLAERYAQQNDLATSANAWAPWGLLADVVLLGAIAGAAALAVAGIASGGRSMRAAALTMALGIAAAALVALHLLGEPRPREIVDVTGWAWAGLGCALAIVAGGVVWWDRAQHDPHAVG